MHTTRKAAELRVARVIAAAEETFGNQEKAGAWLRRGTTALDGEPPLDLLDTEEGARKVETLLTRIGHGLGARGFRADRSPGG